MDGTDHHYHSRKSACSEIPAAPVSKRSAERRPKRRPRALASETLPGRRGWVGLVAGLRLGEHGVMAEAATTRHHQFTRSDASVSPGRLIDLVAQLRDDETRPLAELQQRDHAIGQTLGDRLAGIKPAEGQAGPAERTRILMLWLSQLPMPAHRGAGVLATVSFLTAVVGALLGYGVIRALFWYDGSQPINVVHVLAVFVVLQVVTLVLFALAAAPQRWGGLGRLAEAMRHLSIGQWMLRLVGVFSHTLRERVESVVGHARAHQRVYASVQRWQLLAWSQLFALMFNAAALLGGLQLVVFTDLSFGWSTTLEFESNAMHAVTEVLSMPWATAWPNAQPNVELIEQTQFFRGKLPAGLTPEATGDSGGSGGLIRGGNDRREGARWWPFLIAALGFYGLLPRVVTFSFAKWRLHRSTVRAVAWTPGVERVLDRLTRQQITTQAASADAPVSSRDADAATGLALSMPGKAGLQLAWAEAVTGLEVRQVGGRATLDDDRAAIAEAHRRGEAVSLAVKSWEPPVLELLDFLRDLRQALPEGCPIEVRLIGDGRPAVWERRLATLGDPWLRLVADEVPRQEGNP